MKPIYYILLIFSCFVSESLMAQGWVRHFPDNAQTPGISMGYDVVVASNGDYITAGSNNGCYFTRVDQFGDTIWQAVIPNAQAGYRAMSLDLLAGDTIVAAIQGSSPGIIKLDPSGNIISVNQWAWAGASYLNSIRGTTDGGFIVGGTSSFFGTNGGSNEMMIAKTDNQGDTVWVRTMGDTLSDNGNEVRQTSDGGYLSVGTIATGVWGAYDYKMYVVKLDANGNITWEKKLTIGTEDWYGNSIQETLDGNYIVGGYKIDTSQSLNQRIMLAVKLDVNGNMLWSSNALAADLDCAALDIIQDSDSNYVLTGYTGVFGMGGGFPTYQLPVVKIDKNGLVLWQKFFFADYYTVPRVRGEAIKETADGAYVVVGTNFFDQPYLERKVLIKMDRDGNAITTVIQGNVFADLNNDCDKDTLEYDLENWVVIAEGDNGLTYYANTDTSGNYAIEAEYGFYDVTLGVPNPYWDTVCVPLDTVILNTPMQVDTVDFPVSALVPCPLLHVDISAPFLRLCFPSYYYVNYCNWGMADAQNAYVQVQLDTFMTYNYSTVSGVHLGNNLYQFDLGTVGIGDCGSFYIDVTIDCDTTLAGITHCTQAHIYPDSLCLSPWTGPNINLGVNCLGDSIHFMVNNSGGGMIGNLGYNIFEDNVMMRTGNYNLLNGETEDILVPTQNGRTYRIEAQQDPNFPPLLGDTLIAIAYQGCGADSTTGFSLGFVTQYSNYDGSPFVDIDCQPNIGSYDPNDKRAYPEGYGAEHYIYQHTDLEYYIRFQNTGTDTAFQVVIIDSLSQFLDVASFEVGASSHNYTYEIFGNGVVKFTFDNILLPDSTTNEAASKGFIKYSIKQKANNPIGTIINNAADIYFDYNAPIRTNTTFHEIGQDFITVQLLGLEDVVISNVDVNVYPNPFHDQATVSVNGGEFMDYKFELYDVAGRLLYQKNSTESQFQIQKPDLLQGVYIYRIVADGELLNSGKLMVR